MSSVVLAVAVLLRLQHQQRERYTKRLNKCRTYHKVAGLHLAAAGYPYLPWVVHLTRLDNCVVCNVLTGQRLTSASCSLSVWIGDLLGLGLLLWKAGTPHQSCIRVR